jgi:hypothetical protein
MSGPGWDSQGLVDACVWPKSRRGLDLGKRSKREVVRGLMGLGMVHSARLESTHYSPLPPRGKRIRKEKPSLHLTAETTFTRPRHRPPAYCGDMNACFGRRADMSETWGRRQYVPLSGKMFMCLQCEGRSLAYVCYGGRLGRCGGCGRKREGRGGEGR